MYKTHRATSGKPISPHTTKALRKQRYVYLHQAGGSITKVKKRGTMYWTNTHRMGVSWIRGDLIQPSGIGANCKHSPVSQKSNRASRATTNIVAIIRV